MDKHLRPDDVTVPEVEYPEPEREVQPSSVQVASEDGEMTATAATGEHKSLVILVQFTDQASMGTTPAQWNSKFFGATDSVRDYFQEASYGKLNIGAASESHGTANDGVVGWLTLPYAHPNTANFPNGAADRKTVADAVKAADAYVNYKAYDANNDNKLSSKELHVTVIAAGQEGSCCRSSGKAVWGHFWTLFSGEQPTVDGVLFGSAAAGGGYTQFGEYHRDHMATLGIMVHEMGHDLGLPDLYDTDLSSEGVGDWSVMGGGSWNTVSGQYLGSVPPFPDAWSRYYEGWVTPKREVGAKSVGQATASDAVYQLHDNPGGLDWVSNVKSGTGEYFLIENRQKTGYDAGLPGCGLLVWHIDESRTYTNKANADDARRLVDLEEADNLNHLDGKVNQGDAGDPYPGTANNGYFHDLSSPSAQLHDGRLTGTAMETSGGCSSSMSATFSDDGVDTLAPTVLGSAPAPNKVGVRRKENVRVVFSEAMQRTTLNKYNITLYRNGSNTPLSATVAPSADNKSATLNPYGGTRKVLAARAWYEVVLWKDSASGLRDANGNLLQGAGLYDTSADGEYVSFWFKTGS